MYLFKLYWSIAKPEGMSGPLLFKAGSTILVMIFTQQTVFTTSCSINFRTMRNIPRQFTSAESTKRRKSGRPKDSDQDEAFESVCEFLEENDEEQLTISDLVTKMGEYLRGSKSTAYGNQYFKEKLLSRYGNSIFVTGGRSGVKNIVTFRGKTCNILREYYNSPREDDEEVRKRAFLQTAAKLIKSDIKNAPAIDEDDDEEEEV